MRVLPTSAGTTALIGDPGPTYRHSCDLSGFVPVDLDDWSGLPVTSRARIRRMLLAIAEISPRLIEAWRQMARSAAIAARAFSAVGSTLPREPA